MAGQKHRRFLAARPRLNLLELFFVSITQLVNVLTWIFYVSSMRKSMSSAGVTAYIIFACVGLFVFFFICAPLIYWPYSHGNEMSPVARRNAFCLAVSIVFFVHHFPITWMEIWIVWRLGWTEVFQGISLILTVICFAVGFFTTWFSYAWKLSKVLQIRYGDAAPSRAPVSAAPIARMSSVTRI